MVKAKVATATPFNLSDVVPFQSGTLAAPANAHNDNSSKWQSAIGTLDTLLEQSGALKGAMGGAERSSLHELRGRWNDTARSEALKGFAESGAFPSDFQGPKEVMRLAGLPKVTMSELRRVVDLLDMVIMPFEYLRPESYAQEPREMKAAIEAFARETPDVFSVYVAAPVQYYDAMRHVKAESDLPIFTSARLSPAFVAMGMAIPMFRTIMQEVSEIRDRTNAHSSRLRQAEQQIVSLDARVTQLQNTVERQQAEMIRQSIRMAKMEADLKAAQERASFMAYEPMMLAVPKPRTVHDDGYALVGPCWGPDFEAIVMKALELRKYEGQRERLRTAIEPYRPPPVSRYHWEDFNAPRQPVASSSYPSREVALDREWRR